MAFTPDGRRLVVASGPSVEVWAADPPARESVVGAFAAERVTVCDTGRLVVATDGASTARVWTTRAGSWPPTPRTTRRCSRPTPTGTTVRFASGGLDRTIRATAVELDPSRTRVIDTGGEV